MKFAHLSLLVYLVLNRQPAETLIVVAALFVLLLVWSMATQKEGMTNIKKAHEYSCPCEPSKNDEESASQSTDVSGYESEVMHGSV